MPSLLSSARRWAILPALGLALGFTLSAPAQFGLGGGFQDAFRPGFTARDVQMAIDSLKLDDTQRFILDTLFEDYNQEFRTGVDGFRQSIGDLQKQLGDDPNPDPGKVMRIVFGSMDEWRQESRQLVDQFMTDLRGLLNDEQTEAWPTFERKLYRSKYLGNGQLAAENLDLIAVVTEMKLDPTNQERVAPVLGEYEVKLDESLRSRENYINESQTLLIRAIQDNESQLAIEVADKRVALQVTVRDVQEYYADAVVAALPADVGQQLRRTVLERTHPKIFRDTQVEQIFEAALKLEGLDESTKLAIDSLYQQYAAQLAAFNDRLLALTREFQPREFRNKVEMSVQRVTGKSPEPLTDPTRDEYTNRREMGRGYVEQLKSLLTPEQFAMLPGARRWTVPTEDEAQNAIGDGRGPSFMTRDGKKVRLHEPASGSGDEPKSDEEN